MRFSRWKEKRNNVTYEGIIKNLNGYLEWRGDEKDPIENELLQFDISEIYSDKISFQENKSYKYSVYNFKYEKLINSQKKNINKDLRIRKIDCYIIIYEEDNQVYYCINRTGNPALTILRKFNNIVVEKEVIVEEYYNTTKDFVSWLFYGDNILNTPFENSELIINKITGFKGNVASKEAIASQISGSGNEVMNALSTLAFMFETEEITYIQLKISYLEEHDLEFGLFINGTLQFELDKYDGNLFFGPEMVKFAKILVLISTQIYPKLKKQYITLSDTDEWNLKFKIQKIQKIGDLIQKQVSEKVGVLSNK